MSKENAQPLLPNCGIASLAHLLEVDVNELMEEYRVYFSLTSRWQGRTSINKIIRFLKHKGFSITTEQTSQKISLTRWVDQHTAKNKTYIVRTGGHLQFVRNSMVGDQRGLVQISDYWGARKRVTHVIKIH